MNIVQLFFDTAQRHPQQAALVDHATAYTYAELAKAVQHTAASLREQGVQAGTSVLVMLPVSATLYIHILAAWQVGAKVVLVEQLFPRRKVAAAFSKAACQFVLTTTWLRRLRYCIFAYPLWEHIISAAPDGKAHSAIAEKNKDETALITFTSGTTGQPKAADRTHGFLYTQLMTIIEETGLGFGDRHLSSFPVVTLCNLAVGATTLLTPKTPTAAFWQRLRAAYPPTVVSASEHFMRQWLPFLQSVALRQMVVGGATLLPSAVRYFSESVAAARIIMVYGSTEAEPIATQTAHAFLTTYDANEQGICVGEPHPNIEVRLYDADKQDFTEGVGEIVVAGAHVLERYFQDPAAMAKHKIALSGNYWHRTGDVGYLKAGKLYYMGRRQYVWQWQGTWYAPLWAEKLADTLGIRGEVTLLPQAHKLYMFHTCSTADLRRLLPQLPFAIEKITLCRRFPKDARHGSRIDYAALLAMLNG